MSTFWAECRSAGSNVYLRHWSVASLITRCCILALTSITTAEIVHLFLADSMLHYAKDYVGQCIYWVCVKRCTGGHIILIGSHRHIYRKIKLDRCKKVMGTEDRRAESGVEFLGPPATGSGGALWAPGVGSGPKPQYPHGLQTFWILQIVSGSCKFVMFEWRTGVWFQSWEDVREMLGV